MTLLCDRERRPYSTIREHSSPLPLVEMAGEFGCVEDEVELFAVEGERCSVVGAIGNHQDRRFGAGIDPDAVGAVQLTGIFALPPNVRMNWGVFGVC